MMRFISCTGLVLCVLGGYFIMAFLLGLVLVWLRFIKYEFFILGILLDVMMRNNELVFIVPFYTIGTLVILFIIPKIQRYIFSSDNTLDSRIL